MTRFEIVFKQSVEKDFRSIPQQDVQKILSRFEALANNPRPPSAEKLSAQERYRVRQGVYRIIYEIQNEQLVVVVVKGGGESS